MSDEKKVSAESVARRNAYAKAEKMLREIHADEFKGLYAKACADLGVEYKPRLTAEERAAKVAEEKRAKAAAKIAALQAEYPDLFVPAAE